MESIYKSSQTLPHVILQILDIFFSIFSPVFMAICFQLTCFEADNIKVVSEGGTNPW